MRILALKICGMKFEIGDDFVKGDSSGEAH